MQARLFYFFSLFSTLLLANILVPAQTTAPGASVEEQQGTALLQTIRQSLAQMDMKALLLGLLFAALTTAAFLVVLWLGNRFFQARLERLAAGRSRLVRWSKRRQSVFLNPDRMRILVDSSLRLFRLAFRLALLSFYLPLVLSFFPQTRGLVQRLFLLMLAPLANIWQMFVSYLPKLFFLLMLTLVTWGAIKLARLIFSEIQKGRIRIAGFDPDWAMLTYKIVIFLLVVAAVVVAFPYLPASESPAFRGVSIFIGVLFSLSSSSAISNIIAGIILTYTGAFKPDDLIRVSDTIGVVTDRTLLVTRLRTLKNEEVSIPNSLTLSGQVINYSRMVGTQGLILHTTVTIGYNVPWRKVQDLLLAAARLTPHVRETPAPFVLQSSLNDYHISYELNIYTNQPQAMLDIYSALHQHIQDQFNTAGVEIMSPGYTALRDGNYTTVSTERVPPDYQPPGFRLLPLSGIKQN